MEIDNGMTDVDVVYTIKAIDNFDGSHATGVFTMAVNDTYSSEPFRFMFSYSGSGNPLDQAEPALQKYFDAQDAAETAAVSDASTGDAEPAS